MKQWLWLVALSCGAVNAQAQDSNVYLGLGVGLADIGNSLPSSQFVDGLSEVQGGRLKVSERTRNEFEDDTTVSFQGLVGYSLTDRWSVELGVHDFGSSDVRQQFTETYSDGSSASGSTDFELSIRAVSLNARYIYPLNSRINLFGKLGGAWSEQERTYSKESLDVLIRNGSVRDLSVDAYNYTEEESHVDLSYGVGASLELSDVIESRVSVSGVELADGRLFEAGLSLIYHL